MICKKCGARHNENLFCLECGAPVRKIRIDQTEYVRKRKICEKTIAVVSVFMLLCLIIVRALFVNYNVNASDKNEISDEKQLTADNNLYNEYVSDSASVNNKCDKEDAPLKNYLNIQEAYNLNVYYINNENELKKSGCNDIYMTSTLNACYTDCGKTMKFYSYKNNIIEKQLEDGSSLTIKTQIRENGKQDVIIMENDIQKKVIEDCQNSVTIKFSDNNQYFFVYTYSIDEDKKYIESDELTYGEIVDTIYVMDSHGDCVKTYINCMKDALITYCNNYVLDITDDGSLLYYTYGKVIFVPINEKNQTIKLCDDNKEVYSLAFVDHKRQIAGLRNNTKMVIISYANGLMRENCAKFNCKNMWIYDEKSTELVYTDENNNIVLRNLNNNTECKYDNSLTITNMIMDEKYFVINEYNKIVIIDKATKEEVFCYKVNTEELNGELVINFIESANWIVINNPLGDCIIWDENTRKTLETEDTIYNLNTNSCNNMYTAIVNNELGIINEKLEFYPITKDYMSYSIKDIQKGDDYNYSTNIPTIIDDKLIYINNNKELIEYDIKSESMILLGDDVKQYLVIK